MRSYYDIGRRYPRHLGNEGHDDLQLWRLEPTTTSVGGTHHPNVRSTDFVAAEGSGHVG